MLGAAGGAGIVALLDWVAVTRGRTRIRWVTKPLALALLIAAALVGGSDGWIVAGLVLGLVGDVALLSDAEPAFLAGLGAFLLGHLAYVVGLLHRDQYVPYDLVGVLIVLAVAGVALPRVLRAAARADGVPFAAVVAAYAAVLGLMTVAAVGTAIALTALGGVLFLVSDTVLAYERFVRPVPRGPVVVIVTYHLAQLFIVVGLLEHT